MRDSLPVRSTLFRIRVPDAESLQSCDSLGICSVYVRIGFAFPFSFDTRWNSYKVFH